VTKLSWCRVKAGTMDVPRVMRSVFMAAALSRVSVSSAVAGITSQALLTFARSARTHRSTTVGATRKDGDPNPISIARHAVSTPMAAVGARGSRLAVCGG
jgi:hypothetical protein